MKFLLNLLFLLGFSAVIAQPFPVGHRQLSLTDPARPGRTIGVEIYYPATTAGDNVPVAAGQFPVLVFGHGFLMVWSSYQPYWETLVPEGYVIAFPTTEGNFSPNHGAFGADLARVNQWLKTENQSNGSIWENHIAPTSAVMGHSMGGGASFLAMAGDTSFTTLIGIAAAETNPSAIQAGLQISKPVLILAGGNDCVTPIPQHQQPMYDTISNLSKCLITLTGGSHCQFAASDFFCNTGESTCQPPPSITPAVQQNLSFQAIVPWLDFYLKGDCAAGTAFQQWVSTASGIGVQQTGLLDCATLSQADAWDTNDLVLYPNPSSGMVSCSVLSEQFQAFEIYDPMGRVLIPLTTIRNLQQGMDLSTLTAGVYFVRFMDGRGGVFTRKLHLCK